MAKICLIIAGAGRSSRFAGVIGKIYVPIGPKPVFLWTLDCFRDFGEITQRLLIVRAEELDDVAKQWGAELKKRKVQLVGGGQRRFDSVQAGLAAVDPSVDLVAVHDAARPTVGQQSIAEAFEKAKQTGAAIVAQQVNQTLKLADSNGCVSHVSNREKYWLAQTPQVFDRELLTKAYAAWGSNQNEVTDDAQVVQAYGHKVHVVAGGVGNIKITTPEDLKLVQAVLLD
ncbi:MAG: 2-C-methyl-D-erythritol 4-phosphate cytidylyltransferase [Actinobacteria bacterium]|nr:2-C-methyl-D-erythritol 4-phosphate cytidylyltransferase [Actinomycetota bacterium]